MTNSWMKDADDFDVHDARESDVGAFLPLITGLGDALLPGQGLRVIQSFEPVPLYAVMGAKGLEHETVEVSDDEFHVYFFRPLPDAALSDAPLSDAASMSAEMRSHLAVESGRVEAIEDIVQGFYDGTDPEQLQSRFESELGTISGTEFAFVEQKMTERGVGDAEFEEHVEGLLDIFRNALDQVNDTAHDLGHPLDTMAKENEALLSLAARMSARASSDNDDSAAFDSDWWEDALTKLWQVDLHYVRKENELFPRLEQKGFDKPSIVMWSIHDKIRDGLKAVRGALEAGDPREMLILLEPALEELVGMTYKEAKILFPTCEAMLTVEEWAEVRRGDDEIGYCLIDEPPLWPAGGEASDRDAVVADPVAEDAVVEVAAAENTAPANNVTDDSSIEHQSAPPAVRIEARPFIPSGQAASRVGAISLAGGSLQPDQINMLLAHLPLTVVFVDESDEELYRNRQSESEAPKIPAETVHAFKKGTLDAAGHWAIGQTSVWSHALAVRDQDGGYRGFLQTTQSMAGKNSS